MTAEEALPFHACLRLHELHPDHLFDELTPGQWEDWLQFDRTFCLAMNRDDLIHGSARADFINANRAEGKPAVRPVDVMPYYDPLDEELTAEELMVRCGFGTIDMEAPTQPVSHP